MNIYIGYDKAEQEMFEVCCYSIKLHTTIDVNIIKLDTEVLRSAKIYSRERTNQQATDFSFSRFLVPYLNNYQDWAMFVDCDFIFTKDLAELFSFINGDFSVMCCQHKDYIPKLEVKMNGQLQATYPRKNWSSLMLFNCSHPSAKTLTPEIINKESGKYLHRFEWCKDEEIGSLPLEWNFLVGEYEPQRPAAAHFTNGHRLLGPEKHNQLFDYSDLYDQLADRVKQVNPTNTYKELKF